MSLTARFFCFLALCALLFATAAWSQTAPAAGSLKPGIYQTADKRATADLKHSPDGSWDLRLWHGESLTTAPHGFAIAGRLLPTANPTRLAGAWQALPGSCCQGRGRQEIEILAEDSFRFADFTPSLDRPGWQVREDYVFTWVAPANPPQTGQRLAGPWRLAMWYMDQTPDGRPSSLSNGMLKLAPAGGGATGQWVEMGGKAQLVAENQGILFEYSDPARNFQITARLEEQENGLVLQGPFKSTLGQGRLRLVRGGLPASPPGPAAAAAGQGLDGAWVDPKTGSDFLEISGSSPAGFNFVAYGGSRSAPRYLSEGRARAQGPQRYVATANDKPGACCGNQGRLVFLNPQADRLEALSFWWPQGKPDPGSPESNSQVFVRQQAALAAKPAAQLSGMDWPVVYQALPGLLSPRAGAVRLKFQFQPGPEKREHYLFSQSDYGRELGLFLDQAGRPGARLSLADGQRLVLSGPTPVKAGEPQELMLVFQAGGEARLLLNGQLAAKVAMPVARAATDAPFLVGGSRWPGRTMNGEISSLALFASAVDPARTPEPELALTPSRDRGATESAQPGKKGDKTVFRLWKQAAMRHAYATDKETVRNLSALGYKLEGAVAGLWGEKPENGKALYAYRRGSDGAMVLSLSATAPQGYQAVGQWGYLADQPGDGLVALYEYRAEFPEPIRGKPGRDRLYATEHPLPIELAPAGYGQGVLLGYAKKAGRQAMATPLPYRWSGGWRGDGWGRFFFTRQDRVLNLFWFYSTINGPHYFGRYLLSEDGKRAEGLAVGHPGPKASYYRHRLTFQPHKDGPRVILESWRLAAPLDDGRLVEFKKPRLTVTTIIKTAPGIPAQATQALEGFAQDPAELYRQARKKAAAQGRLLNR